jgi:orotidine-5'-phosphate decarboxylase
MHAIPLEDRLIVALDLPTVDEARTLVQRLGAAVGFYKIGLQLLFAGGVELARELAGQGKKVFLDAKLLDIDQTVESATRSATALGIDFLTIHGLLPTMQAAVRGRGTNQTRLLAVTVLTSQGPLDMAELGTRYTVEEMVLRRAVAAVTAGCDGVIASGREARAIRAATGTRLLIVAPGIRSTGIAADDQKRATTPEEAIAAGADYLVMGREILRSPEPGLAAEAILRRIEAALTANYELPIKSV